jgi:hypothetical protein
MISSANWGREVPPQPSHPLQLLDLLADPGLERAVQLGQLIEEADVLDGDDRLVGEGLDELSLGGREILHLVPPDPEHADRRPLPQQRRVEQRPVAVAVLGRLARRILLVGLGRHVVDVHQSPAEERAARD